MPQLGVDYANTDSINKPGVAGFEKAKAAGARVIIPRAVYGRAYAGQSPCFIDSYWARDRGDIVSAGLIRSAYLFVCVPRKGFATPEPHVQVEQFWKQISDYLTPPCEGKRQQDLVPFFDVEEHSDLLTSEQYFDWIVEVAKLLRAKLGAWPGMYTSKRVWDEELNDHAAGSLINCPLWLAKPWPWNVRTPVHLDGAPGWYPNAIVPTFGDKTNWLIYQYQGDGLGMPGFSPGAVDMNRCQMSWQGCKGTFVKWIQARAGKLTVDGDFGPKTKARIQELQAIYALDADGVVGADTAALLSWLNPAPL